MPNESGTFRRALYIPKGTDVEEVKQRLASTLERFPAHELGDGVPDRSTGKECTRVDITFKGAADSQLGLVGLQNALDMALHGNQLDRYLATGPARTAT